MYKHWVVCFAWAGWCVTVLVCLLMPDWWTGGWAVALAALPGQNFNGSGQVCAGDLSWLVSHLRVWAVKSAQLVVGLGWGWPSGWDWDWDCKCAAFFLPLANKRWMLPPAHGCYWKSFQRCTPFLCLLALFAWNAWCQWPQRLSRLAAYLGGGPVWARNSWRWLAIGLHTLTRDTYHYLAEFCLLLLLMVTICSPLMQPRYAILV